MLEMVNEIKKDYSIELWLIGDGPDKEKYKKYIKDNDLVENVKLLGMKTNPYPYMLQCDIYVQPSRFEGFGLAIAEARLLNKPVVATNFEIVHDQITNNVNGVISDMNSESIAKSLMELINDKDLSYRIIEKLKDEKVGTEEEINKNNLIDTKESKEITDYSFNLIVLGTQVSPLN